MASQQLWTQRYRPQTLDDVVGHDVAIERFRAFLDDDRSGGLPHCLLYGPPGVGKTAVAMAWAADYYGDHMDANVREFNASDDRGIDVIREQIKGWAKKAPSGGYPYKVIFLDEADRLTSEAQDALRRVIEPYSDTTRFILSCNYINQIADPLQSRTAPFYFSELADDELHDVAANVIEGEAVEVIDDAAIDKLVAASQGRARDVVRNLQVSVHDDELREDMVESVTGVVDDDLVRDIYAEALAGNIEEATERLDVELLKEGANPQQLVDALFRVLKDLFLDDATINAPDWYVKAVTLLAEIDERLQKGLHPHIQFHALLGHVYMAQGLSTYSQQNGGGLDG